ncbi:hypothetical protein ScPMuIL_003987 [Solemya velum]
MSLFLVHIDCCVRRYLTTKPPPLFRENTHSITDEKCVDTVCQLDASQGDRMPYHASKLKWPKVKEDAKIRMVSTTDNSGVSILKKPSIHYTNLSRGDVIDYTFTGYDGQTYSDIVDITKKQNVECAFATENKSPFFRVESVHRSNWDNGTIGKFCPLSTSTRKYSSSQFVQFKFKCPMYPDYVSISSDSLFSGVCASPDAEHLSYHRVKKIYQQCKLFIPESTTTFEVTSTDSQVDNKTGKLLHTPESTTTFEVTSIDSQVDNKTGKLLHIPESTTTFKETSTDSQVDNKTGKLLHIPESTTTFEVTSTDSQVDNKTGKLLHIPESTTTFEVTSTDSQVDNKTGKLLHIPESTTKFEVTSTDSQVDDKTDILKKDDDSNRTLTGWLIGSIVATLAVASILAGTKYLKYRSRRRGRIVRPV